MTSSLWRIAADTPSWTAEDLAGNGAACSGSRWNYAGEHLTCVATSISLAAWETRAHFAKGKALPWNRILVRIDVPDDIWGARAMVSTPLPAGWNVIPEGMVSRTIGSAWLASGACALLVVPSVIINEEDNVLINSRHADVARIRAHRIRQFIYDPRV
ncbi:MAG: RES family NAD+ phosphorylase [Sphingomonadaceae bacterium]